MVICDTAKSIFDELNENKGEDETCAINDMVYRDTKCPSVGITGEVTNVDTETAKAFFVEF